MATIPPHPFYIGDHDNNYDVAELLFDQDSMWFVSPQLFFHCTLHPISARVGGSNHCNKDIPLDLVFFSPFEELHLRTAGIMESRGIHRVNESSPVPTLYIGLVEDLLGRVPLIPCFLEGNSTSTIPHWHKYSSRQKDTFECGYANGAGPN